MTETQTTEPELATPETQEPEAITEPTPETTPETPKKRGAGRPRKHATPAGNNTDETAEIPVQTGGKINAFGRKRTRKTAEADDLINEAEKERKISPAEKKNILESYRSGGKVGLATFDILQAKLFAYLHGEDTKDHMLTDDEKELIQVPLDDVIKDLAEKANGVLNPYWLLAGVLGMVFLPKIILVGDKKGWFDMKNYSKKKNKQAENQDESNAFFDEIAKEKERIREEHFKKQEAEFLEKARLEAERIAREDAEIEQILQPKMKVVNGDSE